MFLHQKVRIFSMHCNKNYSECRCPSNEVINTLSSNKYLYTLAYDDIYIPDTRHGPGLTFRMEMPPVLLREPSWHGMVKMGNSDWACLRRS